MSGKRIFDVKRAVIRSPRVRLPRYPDGAGMSAPECGGVPGHDLSVPGSRPGRGLGRVAFSASTPHMHGRSQARLRETCIARAAMVRFQVKRRIGFIASQQKE